MADCTTLDYRPAITVERRRRSGEAAAAIAGATVFGVGLFLLGLVSVAIVVEYESPLLLCVFVPLLIPFAAGVWMNAKVLTRRNPCAP